LELDRAFGLDMNGRNIYEMVWPRDMYLVVGEEGQGLPEELKATRVSIPMRASIESLNAVAAAAIALFSYRQRFPLVQAEAL
jgi:TrmH family RNA methyltransferase